MDVPSPPIRKADERSEGTASAARGRQTLSGSSLRHHLRHPAHVITCIIPAISTRTTTSATKSAPDSVITSATQQPSQPKASHAQIQQ
ncbi:hypothetical protein HA45_11075 [Pantoea rodasii]|nr:hypothetical protein HA45_11075 [Pantoea rodasii]